MSPTSSPCYCGGDSYALCCQPIHSGSRYADNPEQLMRARYSACCRQDIDFLLATTHLSTQALYHANELQQWLDDIEWLSLRIISSSMSSAKLGHVDFVAFYHSNNPTTDNTPPVIRQHREYSRFQLEDTEQSSQWYFVSGEDRPDTPLERNQPCPCRSGKKYKKCCL
ncbi:SEC-C motif-containing protein [Sinobacterium caligoides]|uniref:SEC-C motif-containing protein n=2 Tax=Sinobacterium caligoides TaxID=933926 RepID=A0A3N2D533_9GAMM|nr:SEC-C motif-containing protein [Sinobacterium caligoides]